MMESILFIFLVAIIYTVSGTQSYAGCIFNLRDRNGMTAEYDLTYFNLNYDVFTVVDKEINAGRSFTYMFDICGGISPQLWSKNTTIPHECKHPASDPTSDYAPCISAHYDTDNVTLICDKWETTTGEIPSAVQIDTKYMGGNETKCYWLGMEVKSADHLPEYGLSLLDKDDAGKGVIFTILNGQWCNGYDGFPGRNRELRVKLECPDDARIEFEPNSHVQQFENTVVEEVETCIYEVTVKSPLACPNKCVSRMNLEMFAVCATYGICEADPYANGDENYPNGTLRCLCDDGHKGDICEEVDTKIHIIQQDHPGLLAAIVICIVLLGVAIVCSAVLCHKIRIEQMNKTGNLNQAGLGTGILHDPEDKDLNKTKADAMTMDIGMGDNDGNLLTSAKGTSSYKQKEAGSSVQLQGMDDQLETDKAQEEQEENELLAGDDDTNDNDDEAPDEEEENTNPGAED